MKGPIFVFILSCVPLFSGCDKDSSGKQTIENKSGYEWNDTKISLRSSGKLTGTVNVGHVGNDKKVTVNTTDTEFQISAKDGTGKLLSSKVISFSGSGTTTVNKSDFR